MSRMRQGNPEQQELNKARSSNRKEDPGLIEREAWSRIRWEDSELFDLRFRRSIRYEDMGLLDLQDTGLSDQDVLSIGRRLITTEDSSSSLIENIKVTTNRFTPLPSISSSDSEESRKSSVNLLFLI